MKNPDKVKMGKKSRASGAAFELRTRKDLEEDGWIVDKWSNNLDHVGHDDINDCPYMIMHPAKHKFRGMGIPMSIGTGFPDFIAFKRRGCSLCFARMGHETDENYDVIGVESKVNGYLTQEEKAKCQWYLDKKIFSKILIASKTKVKNRIVIKYEDFNEKYG